MFALGLGAGLRGKEMDELTWEQVEMQRDGNVILRDVDGRDVPVMNRWGAVMALAHGGEGHVLYPGRKERSGIAGSVLARSMNEGLRPSLPRMRPNG
ncbi:hypothetical protein CRD18_07240 [Corynebacterium sp. LK31]|nr:hypothetical protein [Corynebacterium sp. LK31]